MGVRILLQKIRYNCRLIRNARVEETGSDAERWLYIVFFNAIWAFFQLWVLRQAYCNAYKVNSFKED